jgi:ferredoxin
MQSLAKIHFMPIDRMASVPPGSSLLDALRQVEIPIEIICGGKGLCRKCRVILTRGSCQTVIQPGGSRPAPEEEEQGIRFA